MDKTRPAHSEHANVIILPPIPYGLTLVAGILLHLWEPVRFFPELWIGHAVGWPVIVAAGLLLTWADRTMSSLGEHPNPYKPTKAMISTGPYGFSRNPMYLCLTLLLVGIAFLVNTVWPVALLPALLIFIHYGVIRREESYLERLFGDEYRRYRARVRRWL